MPSTMELAESPSSTGRHCDSAFYDEDHAVVTALDRIKVAVAESENVHTRTASLDSGVDMQTGTLPVPTVSMRRVGSATQLRRPRTDSNLLSENISNQTLQLIKKMEILEKKLLSMDTQLKHERVLRLSLEAKVVRLEEDRDALADRKSKASEQLQDFSERFFATMDSMSMKGSMSPSPSSHRSLSELRSVSRAGSDSSYSSGLQSRPLSGVSIASN